MEVNQEVVVAVIKKMKYRVFVLLCLGNILVGFAQTDEDVTTYKKRVLETTEVDFLMSYYTQEGSHAAVTGGVGNEELKDITPTFIVAIPLNADDVLTIDAGISAYSSASSSNLNPFDISGASGNGYDDDDDDDDDDRRANPASTVIGSPWVASSGASSEDVWYNLTVNYSHSSDDRNLIWTADLGFASEYDYTSFGFGGGVTKLFNEKNTELGLKVQVYLDQWNPQYPTELDSYIDSNQDLNTGYFSGIDILNQSGQIINKNAIDAWTPFKDHLVTEQARNSYSLSLNFSQILSKKAQLSLFLDLVSQSGWLANPMQRVYFADRANFFVGNAQNIPNYTSSTNIDVFQLADDIERLPSSRIKTPFGMRLNYFINESVSVRTYYRFYMDDWGMNSHTASIEFPIKLALGKFTLYPNFRFYNQTAIDYFKPFESHQSTSTYYTSDFDLSKFVSHQYGMGIKYLDIFSSYKIFGFGLKSAEIRYSSYNRSDGLHANIISTGIKFVSD